MNHIHINYEKKKRRIRLNGIFYAVISSASFGFSPLFSIGLLAAGLSNFDVLSRKSLLNLPLLTRHGKCFFSAHSEH